MSIDVFKVGRIWHYRFQVRPFKRVQRSTKLQDRRLALRVAEKAYADAVARANGGEPIPTLRALIKEWLAIRAVHSSAAHVRSVETFARLHLYDLGDALVSDIDTVMVERARSEHLKTHSFASANHWLRVLKLLVNWAVKREILPRLPWSVTMLTVQKRPRSILPLPAAMDWFDAIDKAAARSPNTRVAVRLMLWLGLRESEVITARWEWFDWERRTYTPGQTKGKEADPLPMFDALVDYLAPLRRAEGLVICRRDGRPLGPGFARAHIQKANAATAIKGITPHRLRGTIATLMSESGAPVQDVQAYLRHKDVRTTMFYLEKNMVRITSAQKNIQQKGSMAWRESGDHRAGNPHTPSLS